MDDAYRGLARKVKALEARVEQLERDAYFVAPGGVADEILKKYPQMMNKTEAAKVMGVTRATVYYMIADGRLKENGMGKITTKSVVNLIKNGTPTRKRRKAG